MTTTVIFLAGVYFAIGAIVFVFARNAEATKRDPTLFLLILCLCFWPWSLYALWECSPRVQRKKQEALSKLRADIAKQRADKLRKHRCGARVEYRPYPQEGLYAGVFRFEASGFEKVVSKFDPLNKELLQWLRDRDDTIKTPVEIPGLWNFHWLTDAIDQGYSKVFCTRCGMEIESFRKETETPKEPAWHATYSCPNGHVLYRWTLGHMDSFPKRSS